MADMKAIMQQLSMQEQYDENAKWLNSQKPFLANILIRTVDDFKGMQPEEVAKLIEGEPSVGRTPVEEGFTNERLEDETMSIPGFSSTFGSPHRNANPSPPAAPVPGILLNFLPVNFSVLFMII